MKVTLRTIAGLLSSAVLVSCSNVSDDPDISQTPIEFGTTMNRAAVSSDKTGLSSFSVWGGYEGAEDLFNKTEVDPSGAYTDGTRYWIPGKTFNFYAVHPAILPQNTTTNVTDVAGNGIIIVTDFDCSATGVDAVDLMTATRKGMDGSKPEKVALTFNHELAKVNFTVKSENTVATISSFKVYGVNYKGTLTKKEQTATWDPVTACGVGDTPFTYTKEFTLSKDNWEKDIFGDVLLIPDDDLTDANLEIIYKYPDETTSRTSTVNLNTTISGWEAGKSYKYTIAIKGGSLSVNVNVNPWDSKDTSVSWE